MIFIYATIVCAFNSLILATPIILKWVFDGQNNLYVNFALSVLTATYVMIVVLFPEYEILRQNKNENEYYQSRHRSADDEFFEYFKYSFRNKKIKMFQWFSITFFVPVFVFGNSGLSSNLFYTGVDGISYFLVLSGSFGSFWYWRSEIGNSLESS